MSLESNCCDIFVCLFHQLRRLQDENNSLVGKHSKRSQEMQDEAIDLPNTVEVVSVCCSTCVFCYQHTAAPCGFLIEVLLIDVPLRALLK